MRGAGSFTAEELEKIRADFPILKREVNGEKLVYLDNAAMTTMLIRRGNTPVLHVLAENRSARISDHGYQALVERSRSDVSLAEKMGGRPDLPAHHLRQQDG